MHDKKELAILFWYEQRNRSIEIYWILPMSRIFDKCFNCYLMWPSKYSVIHEFFSISISEMKKQRHRDAKNIAVFWKLNKMLNHFSCLWFQKNLSLDFSSQFKLPKLWSLCRSLLLCESHGSFLQKQDMEFTQFQISLSTAKFITLGPNYIKIEKYNIWPQQDLFLIYSGHLHC